MYKHRRGACFYIVGVEASDGEVTYGRVVGDRSDGKDMDRLAAWSSESGSAGEVIGSGPHMGREGPEFVVFGGDDDAGPVATSPVAVDGDLDQALVVGATEGCDDRFSTGLTGRGVGGEYLVAYLDLFDRLWFAIGEEYRCSGDEAVNANAG